MGIEMSADLMTGIVEIDEPHRDMFRRVNRFLAACNESQGASRVRDVLGFMRQHALDHFRDEEVLMMARGFPDIAAHKKQHAEFVSAIAKLEAMLHDEGASENVVAATRHVLVEWLVSHIRKMDKAFADYARSSIALS